MLDEHKVKRKPARNQEKKPRVKYHILTEITQDQEPEIEETLEVRLDEETQKPAEQEGTQTESQREFSKKISADTPQVPLPEVHSAIKNAIENAMQPSRSSFLKPARRPKILPPSSPPDEPEPGVTQDLVQSPPEQEIPGTTYTEDPEVNNPPFCKNCGKRVPPAAIFCPMCGINLGGSSPPTAPVSLPGKKTIRKGLPVKKKKATPPK
ncbi:MAG: zinc ribbon domain-containing protein [Methanoregula sp.]|jgi:hypothetical protein|nr:zinc ribbon domain-containing protein [Methanoregula sp.]